MPSTHQRQTSLPPPYMAHSINEAASMPYLDDISPTTQQQLYQNLPYYASLPAFDSPPNYSRRLRKLVESRRRPLQLSLVIPVEKPKIIEQIFYDDASSSSSSSSSYDIDQEKSTNLLGNMSCDGDMETYTFTNESNNKKRSTRSRCARKLQKLCRRRRQHSLVKDDREISWMAFAGMASIMFMVLCSCSIFIAWSTGVFHGVNGLEMMQAQMHGMQESAANMWDPSSLVLEGSSGMEEFEKTTTTEVAVEIAEDMPMMSRREEIQKRAERRRRSMEVEIVA